MEIIDSYGFIYITTNMINGTRYIGQRKFDAQKGKWQEYLGSGVSLKRALKKYGRENFIKEIVAIAYSKKELDYLEIEFIKNHNAVKSSVYYNIAKGGKTGYTGNPFINKTEEEMISYRRHMSEIKKGEKNGRWKGGISKNKSGVIYISKYKPNGKKRDYTIGANNGMYGKKHSKETLLKMSEKREGNKNANAKKVLCITTGKIFECMLEGALNYNLKTTSSISQCLHGKQKTAGKLTDGTRLKWSFV